MSTFATVVGVLNGALQLGPQKAAALRPDSQLLGGIPEFDSMAVVSVVTMLEDELGITIEDDELTADIFGSVQTLVDFVERKLGR